MDVNILLFLPYLRRCWANKVQKYSCYFAFISPNMIKMGFTSMFAFTKFQFTKLNWMSLFALRASIEVLSFLKIQLMVLLSLKEQNYVIGTIEKKYVYLIVYSERAHISVF